MEAARERAARPETSGAPSTPGNRPRRAWSRSSIACMPSARPGSRTLPARRARAGSRCRTTTTMAGSRAARWSGPALKRLLRDVDAGHDRRGRGLQDRPPVPLAHRLRRAGRCVRTAQCHIRQRHPAVQHDDLHGQAHAQHPARRSRNSSARSSPSESGTSSLPLARRACGWAGGPRWATMWRTGGWWWSSTRR